MPAAIAALDEAAKCAGVPVGLGTPLPAASPVVLAVPPIVANSVADPRTPIEDARSMAAAFRGARLVSYDSTQHVTWLQTESRCVNRAIARYVLDRRPPARDLACPSASARP